MSSKNNGAPSIPNDHYPTPLHAVTRLYEACPEVRKWTRYLDPMADEGQLVEHLGKLNQRARLDANELRPECAKVLALTVGNYTIGDAFDIDGGRFAEACVTTNPAFTLFERTARHFRSAPVLALLGPAAYLSGGGLRNGIVKDLGMPDIYLIPERLAFVRVTYMDEDGRVLASGSSDSQGSAWYVWHERREEGSTRQLREPTAAEKRSHVPPTWVNVVRAEDWETA